MYILHIDIGMPNIIDRHKSIIIIQTKDFYEEIIYFIVE